MADLVTLEEYTSYKNITTHNQDNEINSIIPMVSELVKTYCNRSFVDNYSVDKVEYFDGYNNTSVFVDEYPIVGITEVAISSDGTNYTVTSDDYFSKDDIGEVTTGNGYPFITTTSVGSVTFGSLKITYKGGYSTTPDDLKLVTLDLIDYYLKGDYNPNKRLQSASVDTVSFAKLGDTAFPPHIKRVLDLYRTIRV